MLIQTNKYTNKRTNEQKQIHTFSLTILNGPNKRLLSVGFCLEVRLSVIERNRTENTKYFRTRRTLQNKMLFILKIDVNECY